MRKFNTTVNDHSVALRLCVNRKLFFSYRYDKMIWSFNVEKYYKD